MPQEYLFSCSSCEKSFAVTIKQAGTEQDCPFCDTANELPTMREIRQLPSAADDSDSGSHTATARNETRSWLFSGGLLVAVIGGLCSWALFSYADKLSTDSIIERKIEFGESQLDRLPAGHLWDAWNNMTKDGLPDWEETVQVRYNKQAGHLTNIAYGLVGVSALGGLALISSFFINRQ